MQVKSSLYQALEQSGNRPVRALQRVRAGAAHARAGGAPAREARATRGCWSNGSGFLQDGRAIEFSQSYYRGDTYDVVAELSTTR
jgi:GntR family transcriptional regulator